ncbi:MAG: CopD family protein [Bacteroidetes bacterium]|nr:CopD family protein [Bacteroidota bacterium]
MLYLYLKSLHIIFIVTWFAGLFYIVRLFIYHAEAQEKPESERKVLQSQFKIMERRLWFGITWPSMFLTIILGLWTAFTIFGLDFPIWLWVKLAFVAGLIFYHLYCHKLFLQFQNDVINWSSGKLRIWNEVATLFLVAIVFLVVLKGFADMAWGFAGFVVFSLLLFAAIRIYKKQRK